MACVDLDKYPLIWELAKFLNTDLPESSDLILDNASYKVLYGIEDCFTVSKSDKVFAFFEIETRYKEVYISVGIDNLNGALAWNELSEEVQFEFVKCFVLPLLALRGKIIDSAKQKKIDNSQKILNALKETMTKG